MRSALAATPRPCLPLAHPPKVASDLLGQLAPRGDGAHAWPLPPREARGLCAGPSTPRPLSVDRMLSA
eukprot:9212747-Pyramimonas_sp.AAC.1